MSTDHDTTDDSRIDTETSDTDVQAAIDHLMIGDGGDDAEVTLQVTVERPLYDLIRLEIDSSDDVEEFVRGAIWGRLILLHEEHMRSVEVPVGVGEDVARRIELRAQLGQARGKTPSLAWGDAVAALIQADLTPIDEDGRDVRDRLDGGGDRE